MSELIQVKLMILNLNWIKDDDFQSVVDYTSDYYWIG